HPPLWAGPWKGNLPRIYFRFACEAVILSSMKISSRALISVAFLGMTLPASAQVDVGPEAPSPFQAQPSPSSPAPTPAPAPEPAPWGFNGTFSYGGAGGDFGNLFRHPLRWEYNFFRQKGPWRLGLGLTFASFKMQEPYQDELEWGYQEVSLFGTRLFNMKGSV